MCSFIEHPATFLLLTIALLVFAIFVELVAGAPAGDEAMPSVSSVRVVPTLRVAGLGSTPWSAVKSATPVAWQVESIELRLA